VINSRFAPLLHVWVKRATPVHRVSEQSEAQHDINCRMYANDLTPLCAVANDGQTPRFLAPSCPRSW